MDKLDKTDAGYQHMPNTQYVCGDCLHYLDRMKKCAIIYDQETVLSLDSCNYFLKGMPGTLGQQYPILNILEADFERSNFGFSCKRCIHFSSEKWDCEAVNKDTPGDDQGMIHPDACCNLQELDLVRGNMPTDKVREFINDAFQEQSPSTMDVR